MHHDPHIVDVVRTMKTDGRKNAEIAMSVGLSESQVRGLCHTRNIKRGPRAPARLELDLGSRLMKTYRDEAMRRTMPFERFMHKLLATIAQDKLFNAIFDDGV